MSAVRLSGSVAASSATVGGCDGHLAGAAYVQSEGQCPSHLEGEVGPIQLSLPDPVPGVALPTPLKTVPRDRLTMGCLLLRALCPPTGHGQEPPPVLALSSQHSPVTCAHLTGLSLRMESGEELR